METYTITFQGVGRDAKSFVREIAGVEKRLCLTKNGELLVTTTDLSAVIKTLEPFGIERIMYSGTIVEPDKIDIQDVAPPVIEEPST